MEMKQGRRTAVPAPASIPPRALGSLSSGALSSQEGTASIARPEEGLKPISTSKTGLSSGQGERSPALAFLALRVVPLLGAGHLQ